MILLYKLFLVLYKTGVSLAANWNSKAKAWIEGRNIQAPVLKERLNKQPNVKTIWFHCASLGEFEQGRPLMEALRATFRQKNCDLKIVLTFFSPSGFEIRKNYKEADLVLYLPLDSKQNAERFLNFTKPDLAVFVKYEFWHFYLSALQHRKIPTILISAIFRKSQPFFRIWGGFHRKMLENFTAIFVQDANSKQLLDGLGQTGKTMISGDTRFDRVIETALNHKPIPALAIFCKDHPVLVAGSTWENDEELIEEWLKTYAAEKEPAWKLILVPHEIHPEHLNKLQDRFPDALRYTQLDSNEMSLIHSNVLIIDRIGILSNIYYYATACYIGGGFNKSGHHNILEAAVYGKPTITGPNYEKFRESVELKKEGGSFTIRNSRELDNILKNADFPKANNIAESYVQQHKGATGHIVQWIMKNVF